MKLRLSSTLPCSADAAWRAETELARSLKGSRPWLAFSPIEPPHLPEKWQAGLSLTVRARLYSLLPLGRYTITVAEFDENAMTVLTHGHGGLIRRWDHRLRIAPEGSGSCRFTDEIDFDAGVFSPIVWLLARLVYSDLQIRRHFKAERAW